jgi:hypothetical protein
MLSLLTRDLNEVAPAFIETMIADLERVEGREQSQLLDWLVANVTTKTAPLKNAPAVWRDDPSVVKQRLFWSVQARSVRAENADGNEQLLQQLERELATAPDRYSGT